MHLVVGLGNPGVEYARNRHNLGFMVLGALAEAADVSFREEFTGRFARAHLAGQPVGLLAPLTFMNRSGESVAQAMRFFDVPLERVLVIHDELDLPFGSMRLKRGGGTGGHNGLRSIVQHGGGPDFVRLRLGIGRPPSGSPVDWVLGDFDESASAELPAVLRDAARAVDRVLADGLSAAMNAVNRHAPKQRPACTDPTEPN